MAYGIVSCFVYTVVLHAVVGARSAWQSNYTRSLQFTQMMFAKNPRSASFLNFYNIALKDCVYECQIRSECRAVNYWRKEKKCGLLPSTSKLYPAHAGQTRTYIRKSDVLEHPSLALTSQCSEASCDLDETCDVESGLCTITECRNHSQDHAYVKGNVLSVGSTIAIRCEIGDASTTHSRCLADGIWSNVVPCLVECPDPPPHINNTVVSSGQHDVGAVRTYSCIEGHVSNVTGPMLITCQSDGAWTTTDFVCEPIPEWCPTDWQRGGESCYFLDDTIAPLEVLIVDILDYCQTYINPSSYMLHIETEQKQNWVESFLQDSTASNWCLGLYTSDLVHSTCNWSWTGTGEPLTYNNWMSGQPDNHQLAYNRCRTSTASYWCLGLNNSDLVHGNWSWTGTGEPLTYSNWLSGQPDNNERVAKVSNSVNYGWRDTESTCTPVCELRMS